MRSKPIDVIYQFFKTKFVKAKKTNQKFFFSIIHFWGYIESISYCIAKGEQFFFKRSSSFCRFLFFFFYYFLCFLSSTAHFSAPINFFPTLVIGLIVSFCSFFLLDERKRIRIGGWKRAEI